MKQAGITEVFAFDHHFDQMGFTCKPLFSPFLKMGIERAVPNLVFDIIPGLKAKIVQEEFLKEIRHIFIEPQIILYFS